MSLRFTLTSLALAFALLASATPAFAVSMFFTSGIGVGGASILTAPGGASSDKHVGSGYLVQLGVVLPVSRTKPHWFELQMGLGAITENFKNGDTGEGSAKVSNSMTWERYPLDVGYYYVNTRNYFRLGAGATYQFGNKISASGSYSPAAGEFDNAQGWFIAADRYSGDVIDGIFSIGLKYQSISYTSTRLPGRASGDSLFLTFSLYDLPR